jgi:DnaA-like protein
MPTVISDQERHRRVVEEDSKRKRDLAGYRRVEAAKARERLTAIEDDPAATEAWEVASLKLAASVVVSTFKLWLQPLRAVGAEGTTLLLGCPDGVRGWTERRYSTLIREALSETPYTDVQFVADYELREGETCR